MQGIVGADLHAFAATNATRKEIGFFECAGRAKETIVFLSGEAGGAAHDRKERGPGGDGNKGLAALEIGTDFGFGVLRKKFEGQAVVRAFTEAIQAKMAFGFAPLGSGDRVIAALAVQKAAVAIAAIPAVLFQAQDRPS